MRLLIDNALSRRIAEGMSDAGHDAVHVADAGMASASDPEIFAFAQREERVIVSADTDFGLLLASTHQTKPSFVLLRRTDKRPSALLRVLLANIARLENDLSVGAVVVIEDNRLRVRKLPI